MTCSRVLSTRAPASGTVPAVANGGRGVPTAVDAKFPHPDELSAADGVGELFPGQPAETRPHGWAAPG